MEIELCQFNGGSCQEWDEYVLNAPGSVFGHLSVWKTIIEEAYGQDTIYLMAKEEGRVIGILPLVFMKSLLFGKLMVSLPYLDEAGICANNEMVMTDLLSFARRLAEEKGAEELELRHGKSNSLEMLPYGEKVSLLLPLAESSDLLWKSLDAKVRNQVRKARKSGLTVQWGGEEILDAFYDIFSLNMRDLASPVHSKKLFASILKNLGTDVRLLLVKKGSQPVAGGVCLQFKHRVIMPWASSLREFRALCPNVLLYWEAINWSCEQGYRQFDFGRSTKGGGTYKFKKQWGAYDEELHWQRTHSSSHGAMLRKEDSRYQWGMWIWKNLPLCVTTTFGPWLRGKMSN